MDQTIAILNELVRERVLGQYALGGAVALLFYTEPANTYDLDVFCLLPPSSGPLVTLTPIYDWLKARGFTEDKEHVLIHGIPVQFIPAYNELVTEAVAQAGERTFRNIPVRVVRLEHLLAIMVQTARAKDRLRAAQLAEEVQFDRAALAEILQRHGLASRWQTWQATDR